MLYGPMRELTGRTRGPALFCPGRGGKRCGAGDHGQLRGRINKRKEVKHEKKSCQPAAGSVHGAQSRACHRVCGGWEKLQHQQHTGYAVEDQVQGYFSNDGTIKSSDSLYLGESNINGVKDAPMYIPTSVITKAIRPPRGSRSAHALSQKNILSLQDSIKNAPLVINDPVRNSIVYVTTDQDSAGNYIIVTLEKNNDLYGENAHKVTSIHGRENITAILEKLSDDATVFVKNANKLNRMLPGNQILKSLALRAKVELDNSSVPNRPQSVNKQFSVSERTPEQKIITYVTAYETTAAVKKRGNQKARFN